MQYDKQINNAIDDIIGTAEAIRAAYINGTSYASQIDRQSEHITERLFALRVYLTASNKAVQK